MDDNLLLRFLMKQSTGEDLRLISRLLDSEPETAKRFFEMETIWSLKDEIRFSDKKAIASAFEELILRIKPQQSAKNVQTRFHNFPWFKYVAISFILLAVSTGIFLWRSNQTIALSEVSVPNGQIRTLLLPDGTQIWLNSGTKLSYPSQFTGQNRNVHLDGEAFFKVSHQADHPFVVETNRIRTRVLGTTFNVKAYPNETVRISLVEGTVEVSSKNAEKKVILHPNEQAILENKKNAFAIAPVNAHDLSLWIDGELIFNELRLSEIAKDLEHRFDVKIMIPDPQLADEVFNCRAEAGSSVKDILNLLKSTRKLDYRILPPSGKTNTQNQTIIEIHPY